MDTPSKAAIRLSHVLDAFAAAGHAKRFPVDVKGLLLDVGRQFGFDDPVVDVRAESFGRFEAGLFRADGDWVVLYNKNIGSLGRLRFSLAHELGHYLVHRKMEERFECSADDMLDWDSPQRKLETEADEFAAALLMPLTHVRSAIDDANVDFDMLGECAEKFGVSLTSMALRWVSATHESAVLVLSRDGFMDWAISTDRARRNGAFFRTRGRVVELPEGSLAANPGTGTEKAGKTLAAKVWFEHAAPGAEVREMKLLADSYGYTLSLLHLSKAERVWPPWGEPQNSGA